MVPMLTCGFVRSNFAFATCVSLLVGGLAYFEVPDWGLVRVSARLGDPFAMRLTLPSPSQRRWLGSGTRSPCGSLSPRLRDDVLGHVGGHLVIRVELHRVARPPGRLRPEVADVAEHLRQRDDR